MSLRFQLISLVAVALLLSLTLGGALVWWQAVGSVETELKAALAVSQRTVNNTVAHLPATNDHKLYLEQLIATFDGNRHVRATLTEANGQAAVISAMSTPENPVPSWFVRVVGVDPEIVTIGLPADANPYTAVSLTTDARNEVGEVWARFSDDMMIIAGFCGVTFLLVYWIAGRGLRPLQTLSRGLRTIGAGGYGVRVASGGPPEVKYLAESFNRMAEQLGTLEAKNRRLHGQLTTIQEEERADLARDLHDEVGPFLFAVNVDAAAVARMAQVTNRKAEIQEQVRSIQDSVDHMQRHVRAILERLRPAGLLEVGLAQAVNNLAMFWRRRHQELSIHVDLPDETSFGEAHDAAIYRLIQESLSNAVRHGQARFIDVTVTDGTDGADDEILMQVSDDGIGLAEPAVGGGFGIVGMKERVAALGGVLTVVNRAGGRGAVVTARLPRRGRADAMTEMTAP
jgi:two-component system sensor histidine kinase UhpB